MYNFYIFALIEIQYMKRICFLAFTAAATMTLSSCGDNSPFVKRSTLEKSQSENAELKSTLETLQSNFAKQNEDLSSILSDLASISQRTAQIHLNVENAYVEEDTIVLIHENIDAIKIRIDKLEQEASKARKLDKSLAVATTTIKQLRQTVSIQEEKIAQLSDIIKTKDATIQIQGTTISSQSEKIQSQSATIATRESQLRETLDRQVEMLYQAGVALEDIADNGDFKISGRRDKLAVKQYRKSIYESAASYYEMALTQGNADAQESLDALKAKIAALEEK